MQDLQTLEDSWDGLAHTLNCLPSRLLEDVVLHMLHMPCWRQPPSLSQQTERLRTFLRAHIRLRLLMLLQVAQLPPLPLLGELPPLLLQQVRAFIHRPSEANVPTLTFSKLQ